MEESASWKHWMWLRLWAILSIRTVSPNSTYFIKYGMYYGRKCCLILKDNNFNFLTMLMNKIGINFCMRKHNMHRYTVSVCIQRWHKYDIFLDSPILTTFPQPLSNLVETNRKSVLLLLSWGIPEPNWTLNCTGTKRISIGSV